MSSEVLKDGSIPAALWALTGAAIILSAGRYAVRLKVFKQFYWDDATHFAALLALVAFAVSTQRYLGLEIQQLAVEAGQEPKPANWSTLLLHARQYQTSLSICAYTSLWFVKFTFLLFYRQLFYISPTFARAWWIVTIFTFVTFWIPIAGILTGCGPTSHLYNTKACATNLAYQQILLKYSCAFQVATDVIIMALPLSMLPRLNLRLLQKIGLALIFSIAVVTVALEILRTVESIQILTGAKSVQSSTYATSLLYAVVEISCTVIISCMPAYGALVGYRRRRKESRYTDRSNSDTLGGRRLISDATKQSASISSLHDNAFAKYATSPLSGTTRGVYEHYPETSPEKQPSSSEVQDAV